MSSNQASEAQAHPGIRDATEQTPADERTPLLSRQNARGGDDAHIARRTPSRNAVAVYASAALLIFAVVAIFALFGGRLLLSFVSLHHHTCLLKRFDTPGEATSPRPTFASARLRRAILYFILLPLPS